MTAIPPTTADQSQDFWRRIRLVAILALSISFVFTTVGSWIAARRLGVANVDLEPEESSSGSQEGWTVHVGVWRSCAQLKSDKGTERWIATGIFYDDDWAESDVSDKDIAIQGKMILQGLSRAVDGLGASMMTLPLAAGLTGLFILYQLCSFILIRRSRWWEKSSVFTNFYLGMAFCSAVLLTTVMAWAFQLVMVAAAHDIAAGLPGLKVASVKQGGVLIMTSVALILQIIASYIQFQLFGSRELESIQAGQQAQPEAAAASLPRPKVDAEPELPAYQSRGASVEVPPEKAQVLDTSDDSKTSRTAASDVVQGRADDFPDKPVEATRLAADHEGTPPDEARS